MSISLKNACFNIWKSNLERKGIKPTFMPIFTRYIGVENAAEYNDILKTFVSQMEQKKSFSVYFDGEIPLQVDFKIMNYVKNELRTMDVQNIGSQDIVLFNDENWNKMFLESLQYVVRKAIAQENFANDKVRDNFILSMILWTYSYIRPMQFELDVNPKCLYYGDVERFEMYFLIMLYRMTFDVIVINPARDAEWDSVDTDKLSKLHTNKQIVPIESLKRKTESAQILQYTESLTVQLEREVESELFNGTGIYRPWQFRDGNVKPVFIRSTIIDLLNNYHEPARVRSGFKTEGMNVFIPCYFFQIDGEYDNKKEYSKLLDTLCGKKSNVLVLKNGGLIAEPLDSDSILKLSFCRLADETFSMDKIKELDFYRFSSYKEEVQNEFLDSINDMLSDNALLMNMPNKNERIEIAGMILSIRQEIIRMLDNFDYTEEIPKVVFFMEKDNVMKKEDMILTGFLHHLGFDVIILSPAGAVKLDKTIQKQRFNYIRLDSMNYDRTFGMVEKQSKGLFQRIGNLLNN